MTSFYSRDRKPLPCLIAFLEKPRENLTFMKTVKSKTVWQIILRVLLLDVFDINICLSMFCPDQVKSTFNDLYLSGDRNKDVFRYLFMVLNYTWFRLQRVKDAKETVHCVECWLQPNLILMSTQRNMFIVSEVVVNGTSVFADDH